MARGLIIAVDGPAGAGKSTISRKLAEYLDFLFLDTGAMYRAVAYKAKTLGIDHNDAESLQRMLTATDMQVRPAGGKMIVVLDGEELDEELRTSEMSMLASSVSAVKEVRLFLTKRQQEIGAAGKVIAEGRDAGTVIFPNADYKFFLDGDLAERAKRRNLELASKGKPEDLEKTRADLAKRDSDDSSRKIAPLKRADDALYIDTTGKDISMVFETVLSYIKENFQR